MSTWRWISMRFARAAHLRQISEHGGLSGVRDPGAIESALARPQNLFAYGSPDIAALAAAYAFGIARNHGFADGNKRTAWVVMRTFVADNGAELAFDPIDAVRLMEDVAAGRISEDRLARWIRKRIVPSESNA